MPMPFPHRPPAPRQPPGATPGSSTTTSTSTSVPEGSSTSGQAQNDEALGIGDDYFPDTGNPGYDVTSYDLTFDVDDDLVSFDAVAKIALTTTESLDELRLDLDGLEVSKATIDGAEVPHRRAGLDLVLTPEEPLKAKAAVAVGGPTAVRRSLAARRYWGPGLARHPGRGQLRGVGARRCQQLVPCQ
ncbi:MAG: hypothetical protein IPI82_00025 [Candidatus Microthrix sp.]|nr:hypothetical protein [Candidatus Microthrix sp.]MBK7320883.1 hypothetical protein [Candidatus Microthrix sp.]